MENLAAVQSLLTKSKVSSLEFDFLVNGGFSVNFCMIKCLNFREKESLYKTGSQRKSSTERVPEYIKQTIKL